MPIKNLVVDRQLIFGGAHSIDKTRGISITVHPRLSAEPIPPIFNMKFGARPLWILEMG
jgi:hypothetical protein